MPKRTTRTMNAACKSTNCPQAMAVAEPTVAPATYMPMPTDIKRPGNHRRNNFAEFALSAASATPITKLDMNSDQKSTANTRHTAPKVAIAKPIIITFRMPILSAKAPEGMPSMAPVRKETLMQRENPCGSRLNVDITFSAAPPSISRAPFKQQWTTNMQAMMTHLY